MIASRAVSRNTLFAWRWPWLLCGYHCLEAELAFHAWRDLGIAWPAAMLTDMPAVPSPAGVIVVLMVSNAVIIVVVVQATE